MQRIGRIPLKDTFKLNLEESIVSKQENKDDLQNLVGWFSHCNVEDLPAGLLNSSAQPYSLCPWMRIVIDAINLNDFPSVGTYTLCERNFWLNEFEELILPNNLILKNCTVAQGTVTFFEGDLTASGVKAKINAIGRNATAFAGAPKSIANACDGATANAIAYQARAYARNKSTAYAKAPGSIAKAFGVGSFAIATLLDVQLLQEDGATTLIEPSDSVINTVFHMHFP